MLTMTRNQDLALTTTLADERWQAVIDRDRSRDGEFVTAVTTTGIYCRPSCPARKPRRENVRFYPDPAAAERAGFRACRRCRPRSQTTPQEELAARAVAWLDAHAAEKVTLPRLAAALGVSAGHLQRTFTRIVGISPRVYLAARRLEAVKSNMRGGHDVTRALHAAGYGSSSRFYDQARSTLGMSPSSYQQGGKGMAIAYGIAATPLGQVLVAATEQGICAVSIGDDETALAAGLRKEYPQATVRRDDEAVRPYLSSIVDYLRQRKTLPRLPIDVLGTPFQRTVWGALQAIPAGERRTYGELAESLGKPSAARAVASACAANPAAIIIPCHRVVPAGGGAGGYRWGVERKRALLTIEGDG